MKFQPAIKFESHLKMGLSGPPGSGKSYTALVIASHLSKKRVAVIDAESGSSAKYAKLFPQFDMLDLTVEEKVNKDGAIEIGEVAKPFTPKRYMEAIRAAHESGEYDVLIIDGISPEWDDAGGCLQTVDELKRKYAGDNEKAATRNAWAVVTPVHKDFVNLILRTKMHVICTMLAHKEEVIVKDDSGRVIDRKKTLEPIQRDGIERIFDIFAKMEERDMLIDKTRCPELDGQVYHKPGKDVADVIGEWLKGEPMLEHPDYDPEIDREVKASDTLVSIASTITEALTVPSVAQLQSRCTSICGKGQWQAMLQRLFKVEVAVRDEGLTTDDRTKVAGYLDKAEAAKQASQTDGSVTPATEQQLKSLCKLCQHTGQAEPENMASLTYLAAKERILSLSKAYNESRQAKQKAS